MSADDRIRTEPRTPAALVALAWLFVLAPLA